MERAVEIDEVFAECKVDCRDDDDTARRVWHVETDGIDETR